MPAADSPSAGAPEVWPSDGSPEVSCEGCPDAPGAAGTSLGPQSEKKLSAGTTNAFRLTSPVLLKVKVISCALPSLMASRLLGRTAEALSLPPMTTEPPAGTVRPLPPFSPFAGFSSADLSVPSTVMDSSVWSVLPLLNRVAETTAGPVDSRSGCVMTIAFWIWRSPTVVAALSGLISSVWAL